ncbi:MAG: sensor histidine kinase [Anaerolineae bacterium]|nr:sensor histidine kinase [Anaerolineae bacterium]
MNAKLISNEPVLSPGYMDKFINLFASIHLSLRTKIMISFFTVIFLLSAVNIMLMLEVLRFNSQYDAIITNITTANDLNGYIKPAIDAEMWDIVSGKTDFATGSQYQIVDQANSQIDFLMANAKSEKSRNKLEVIRRTMQTLTHYINVMGEQIEQGSRVAENEAVLTNIRGVSTVIEDSVRDYMLVEVNEAEKQYQANQARFTQLSVLYMILLPAVIAFSVLAAWIISASIYIPIKKLHDVTTTITGADLEVFVTNNNVDEITELGLSFNIMIGKIRELLNAKIKEHDNLQKAELKALQAQINPHFLYNTLDTIVWLAEANKSNQVIEMACALSSFFRIALSKGRDWITLRQEIEHVRSYLTIQKMRYQDILDYEIEVEESLLNSTILKLTLQPLVENALYHGIKTKKNGGKIFVHVNCLDENQILLDVEDNGVGFTPYKLTKIQTMLTEDSEEISMDGDGFGLGNVNKRIKLYYGKEYGLSIASKYRVGTRVTLAIPKQESQMGQELAT